MKTYTASMFAFDISACWFRWHEAAEPGKYVANVSDFNYQICKNVACVVDDFGTLVAVHS